MKKHINYIYFIVAFVAILLLIFTTKRCRNQHERSVLTVVIDSGLMRYVELEGDSIFGLQYEIVKAFSDSINLELVVSQQNDLKQSINNLLEGKCDIVASLIPATTEWIDHVAFTKPLLVSRQVLVQQADMPQNVLTKQYELAHDTIFLSANSPHRQRIMSLSNEIADTIFVVEMPNTSPEQLVQAVAEGRCKYTVCNERLAKKMKQTYPNIDISMPIGFEQAYCWAVSAENPQLLERINLFLDKFMKTKEYQEIYKKYY
jgi:membrane-bound lytic murein transglycosylase F